MPKLTEDDLYQVLSTSVARSDLGDVEDGATYLDPPSNTLLARLFSYHDFSFLREAFRVAFRRILESDSGVNVLLSAISNDKIAQAQNQITQQLKKVMDSADREQRATEKLLLHERLVMDQISDRMSDSARAQRQIQLMIGSLTKSQRKEFHVLHQLINTGNAETHPADYSIDEPHQTVPSISRKLGTRSQPGYRPSIGGGSP